MKSDAPIYAVVDRRTDGTLRIVSTFVDPDVATKAADLLRRAGSDARVELIARVDRQRETEVGGQTLP